MNNGYIEVLNSIGSSAPTPGGGTVGALTLAHAHALSVMVARLTVKSEKWADGHSVANEIISDSGDNIANCITLGINDSKAFDDVMEAYRLPNDKEGANVKSKAITNATIYAAKAPLKIMEASTELLQTLAKQVESCNSNALTDLASAAELALSACKIAQFNVRINLDSLSKEDTGSLKNTAERILSESIEAKIRVDTECTKRLEW